MAGVFGHHRPVGGLLIGIVVDCLALPGTIVIGAALSFALAREHLGSTLVILGSILLLRSLMTILSALTYWSRDTYYRLRRRAPRALIQVYLRVPVGGRFCDAERRKLVFGRRLRHLSNSRRPSLVHV